jgi:putative hemolysin
MEVDAMSHVEIQSENIFNINLPGSSPIKPALNKLANMLAGRVLGFDRLQQLYEQAAVVSDPRRFIAQALRLLGVCTSIEQDDLNKIPQSGPLVVVSNHPFGALEGLVLAYHLLGVRDDIKIMANYLLGRIPQLRDLFVFVDPFDTSKAVENNVGPLRESIRWVEGGGLLAAFPAGEVAHLKMRKARIVEPEWNRAVARVADKVKANVVTVHFQGRNSNLFQMAGLIHPRLRTALLPREIMKKSGQKVIPTVGGPIQHKIYKAQTGHQGMADYLRWRTSLLGAGKTKRSPALKKKVGFPHDFQQEIAPAQNPELVKLDVESLPPEQTLLVSGDFKVFYARRRQIPSLINEIGRLREACFRQVGEGTGLARDLDRFDDYYLHLCLWNQAEDEFVGGYRLGLADQIIEEKGIKGLYTSTLFKFQPEFFQRMPGTLEMGRSFVTQKYQRSYSALLLLWKGIGSFVVHNPRYRYLFGPVSVSSQYSPASQRLMLDYLDTHYASPLADLVQARRPPRLPDARRTGLAEMLPGIKSFDEVSEIVSDLEQNGMGAPILLKQYLKLAALSAGWNLDPDFGNALDCLLVADLMQAETKTMNRYCGKNEADAWRAHHRGQPDSGLARCA